MKISYRQLSVLVFMSFIALKLLALPGLMYNISESESILVLVVSMGVDTLFVFWIVDLIKQSGKKNIYEFMNWTIGPVLTKVCLLILMLRYSLIIAHLSKGLEFFVVENLYKEMHYIVYVLPLVALVAYMVYKGIRNIARVHELVYIFIAIGLIYIGLKSLDLVDVVSAYLPFFSKSFINLAENSYIHMNWFCSSSFLFMLFGIVDFSGEKKMQLFRFILFAILLVTFLFFVFYGLFEVTSPIHNFCISDISEHVSGKTSIGELSWLVISLWIVAQAIQLALYAYCMTQAVKYLFDCKTNVIPILMVMAYIVVWSVLGERVLRIEDIFFTKYSSLIAIASQYIITPILWCGYKVKTHKLNKGVKDGKVKHNI